VTDAPRHPFEQLTPDFVMDAVESVGYRCDRRVLALNSYENRVFQVGIDEGEPLIVKFYRPERWSEAQILEEHAFAFELLEQELPVVAPLCDIAECSLFEYGIFRFALFPRRGGHAPEFDHDANLVIMGRLLGRLHAVGAIRPFTHRPVLDVASFGHDSVALIGAHFIPDRHRTTYQVLAADLLQGLDSRFAELPNLAWLRCHGDCHPGNILWRDDIPNIVDLDDARMAPAVQDLWMMLSGSRERQAAQLGKILDGYCEFADFDPRERLLIEPLRALRILHHTAWLARRWNDPAFPHHFPWFNTDRYWDEHILALRELIAALHEPPLPLV